MPVMFRNDSASRKHHNGALPFAALLLVTGLFRASQIATQTIFSPFGYEALKLSPSLVGLGMTLVGSLAALTNLFLVSRLHLFRLRRVGVFGLAILSSAIVGMVLGDSLPTYMASAVILGVSGGLTMPVLATLASRVPEVKRDRALAAHTVALSAGLAIGPFLESVLLSANGGSLRNSLLIFAPIPLVAVALMPFVVSATRPTGGAKQDSSFPASLAGNAPLRLAVAGQLLYQVPFVAVVTFGALIARSSYGVSASVAQLSFTVFFIFSFITRVVLVWKPSGNHGALLLRISAIATLAGVLLLGTGHSLVYLMTAMALLGVPHGFIYPVSISLIARGTTPAELPKANSILFASTSVISVVGPFILGVVTTHFGYRTMLTFVLVPVAALTIILFRIGFRPQP